MNMHVIAKDSPAPEPESRLVEVSASLWAPLIRYAIAHQINLETAVNSFIRDGLEGPWAR